MPAHLPTNIRPCAVAENAFLCDTHIDPKSSQVGIDPKHGGRYRDGRRHGRHSLLYTKFAAAGRQLPRQRSTKMLRCSVQPQRPSFEVGF
jgi:hypothetical protein